MQKLHLVGFTTDLEGLIFSARKGAKSGGFLVPLDDQLLGTIAEAARIRNGESSAGKAKSGGGEQRGDRPANSLLTPRQIQARLRAGQSIEEVAAEAKVDTGWVERFAVPIVAEQARMLSQARSSTYSKARLGQSTQDLATSVRWNLVDKGVILTADAFDEGWRAFQLQDDLWIVRFRYTSRGREQLAEWEYDAGARRLTSRNRLASELGYVEKGRRRRPMPAAPPAPAPPPPPPPPPVVPIVEVVVEEPEPEPEPPARPTSAKKGARRRPAAKKATKRTTRKRATKTATKRKAAPRKAATKRAAPRRTAAKKSTPGKSTARKSTARKTAAKKTTAKKTASRSTAARRAAPKKAARKAPARKAPARKRPPSSTPPGAAPPVAAKKAPARRPLAASRAGTRPQLRKRLPETPPQAAPAPARSRQPAVPGPLTRSLLARRIAARSSGTPRVAGERAGGPVAKRNRPLRPPR